MVSDLTFSDLQNIISDDQVFNDMAGLQLKIKNEYDFAIKDKEENITEMLQESPKTLEWIKSVVVPNIANGSDGLHDILTDIKNEEDPLVGAIKFQSVLDILSGFNATLEEIKLSFQEGEYSFERVNDFIEKKSKFKVLH
jgi:hypothetical protein